MRPSVLLAGATGIALTIAAYAVLAPDALPRLRQLQTEERSLQEDVVHARAANQRLADEVVLLQGNAPSSDAVLEKAARAELGWVKADELVLTGLDGAAAVAARGAQ